MDKQKLIDKVDKLKMIHGAVWNFRGHIEAYWPTPDVLSSLRYAATECGEVIDAQLRLERPLDSRNSEREPNMLEELADVAIMLFTAINSSYLAEYYEEYDIDYIWFNVIRPDEHRVETLNLKVADALMSARNDADGKSNVHLSWTHHISLAIGWLDSYPGFDMEAEIKKKLEKIATKHFPNYWIGNQAAIEFADKALPWLSETDDD